MRINLRLVEMLVQAALQGLRAQQIVAEGLFDHHAAPAMFLLEQIDAAQLLDDAGKFGRPHRHVEHHIGRKRGIFVQQLMQFLIRVGIAWRVGMIMKPRAESLEGLFVVAFGIFVVQHGRHFIQPLLAGPRLQAGGENHHFFGQAPRRFKAKQRGDQLDPRQIPAGAENHQGAGFQGFHFPPPACFTAWPPNAFRIMESKR